MPISFADDQLPKTLAQLRRFHAELITAIADLEASSGGGVSDGDKGDVTVSSSGTVWTVDALPQSRITGLESALAAKADASHTHAISDVTNLQTSLDGKASSAIQTEVETARGSAANLNARITTISNFASPNAGGIVSGRFYDAAFQATAATTLAGAANRMDLMPFYTSASLAIDQIGVAVSTAVASALAKVVIYSAASTGWPDELLLETGTLNCGTTGYKSENVSFTFLSGTIYWVGVRHSSTATLRAYNVSSAVNLGLTGNTATTYATILRSTVTFASAAPDPYTFNASQLTSANPSSVRFRAA